MAHQLQNTFHTPVDRGAFKHDKLDQIRLKNLKKAFRALPESRDKIVTLYKWS